MLRSSTPLIIALCISTTLCTASLGAPRAPAPQPLTEDMKRVLSYNDPGDTEPPAARPQHSHPKKKVKFHKPKPKQHARRPRKHIWPKHRAAKRPSPLAAGPLAPTPAPNLSPPVYSFNGPYAGVGGGAQKISRTTETNPFGAIPPFRPHGLSHSFHAGVWGFAGFNYPIGPFVAGIEADAGVSSPFGALVGVNGSLRARLGAILLESAMIYATGGVMLADAAKWNQSPGALEAGWIAGGGIETFITQDVSVRTEFLYGQSAAGHHDSETIRSGLAVKF